MRIVLASASPRRKELLAKIASSFDIVPSLSEEVTTATIPTEVVMDLAEHKARDVFQTNSDALVIGCDTVVDLDGKILGKPKDTAEATQMLNDLSGKTHFVHTGCFVICKAQSHRFCETTAVTFRKLSPQEVEAYVQSGAPMDKAGAYGIQECNFVESYSGSYDNVVGFPTEQMAKILEKYKG